MIVVAEEFHISLQSWEHFFKPEVRHQAEGFLAKGKVTSSQLSDTEIQAYVHGTTNFKVMLKSKSVASTMVNATCTCPASKKGNFCKHIWAALLKIQLNHPKFLQGKSQKESTCCSHLKGKTTPRLGQSETANSRFYKLA